MKTISIFVITVVLLLGLVGCAGTPIQYDLTISSTEGGEITTPGEGTFPYDEGTVVPLVAFPHTGYRFVNWTGDVSTIANINAASTTITMNSDYLITANFEVIPAVRYSLTISSTTGGSVTTPGQGTFTYDAGTVVDLVAKAEEGYGLAKWTGNVDSIADVNNASTTITMNGDYTISANFGIGIYDWYDLDAIRENLGGSHILMNGLDSTTAGYEELASPTANGGKGWEPIGTFDPYLNQYDNDAKAFTGIFDGRGYEARDLFVNRSDQDYVGLFGGVGQGGVIQNLGVVNAEVTGSGAVGNLVGYNAGGTVSNSYATGSVTGSGSVGGLVGHNHDGTVVDSYSVGTIAGYDTVGGLVGANEWGTISRSYSSGGVTGQGSVGGLVGRNWGTVSNSHYNYDKGLINGEKLITMGALFNEGFEQWISNDRFLDVNGRLAQEDGYYLINDVTDFKEVLAFGQDGSLKFRLKDDLDLSIEPNLYIPYLAGEFDGNDHKILNLSLNLDFVSQVGLFGCLASGGEVTRVGVENLDIAGKSDYIGGLVGWNDGTVTDSYCVGSVTGRRQVGGLVGHNHVGTVRDSYFSGSVAGEDGVGGV
jgi:hypothetical protein